MSDKVAPPKSFLDNSVVYKLQVGATAHKEYLSGAIPKNWYINNYVEMEYYRALLIQCIEMYFESAEPIYATLGDAFKGFAEHYGRQPKVATNVVTSMQSDGYSVANPKDKEILRQKLQDFIFVMVQQFRETFIDMGTDPSNCSRVRHPLKLPNDASERDAILRRTFLTFKDTDECRNDCTIEHLFESEKYKKRLLSIAEAKIEDPALAKIQAAIKKGQENPDRITCTACSKMSDAIVAVSLDSSWKYHSMDNVHEHICDTIKLEVVVHPSFAALKKEAAKASTKEQK